VLSLGNLDGGLGEFGEVLVFDSHLVLLHGKDTILYLEGGRDFGEVLGTFGLLLLVFSFDVESTLFRGVFKSNGCVVNDFDLEGLDNLL